MSAMPQIDQMDGDLARALLEWQVELGVGEAIAEAPLDRFDLPAPATPGRAAGAAQSTAGAGAHPAVSGPPAASAQDLAAEAARLAAGAADLPALAQTLADWPHCELRRGARSCVFADGNPAARVMIVGEGPGREEDLRGLPFVGPAGQMLDAMFAAIGLSRDAPDPQHALYITNTVPWRPPLNREPSAEELDQLRPFLLRHIELAAPDLLVLMGNVACQALLGRRGILRLRGQWVQAAGRRALPMLHPAYLLRNPESKRDAWADLLDLNATLRDLP